MWQMWYMKWRTAEFLNNSNTEEILSERGEGSMKLGESKEDYLEAAYVIKQKYGFVRNTMICDYLNYSKASVSIAMRGLREQGYVIKDQYGSIELTEAGKKVAKKVYARHVLLEEFLELVGVSSEIANRDACRMEHAISEESYLKIQQLVKKMKEEKLLNK